MNSYTCRSQRISLSMCHWHSILSGMVKGWKAEGLAMSAWHSWWRFSGTVKHAGWSQPCQAKQWQHMAIMTTVINKRQRRNSSFCRDWSLSDCFLFVWSCSLSGFLDAKSLYQAPCILQAPALRLPGWVGLSKISGTKVHILWVSDRWQPTVHKNMPTMYYYV